MDGSGSSKAVVRSELKKNLMESNHKVIALQTELSNTKDKLNQARTDHEKALTQVRDNKDMVKTITESLESLKTDCQQATDARDNCLMELKSVKLCNQALINELKESQKSYTSVHKELQSLRSKKDRCSTCEKKPMNSNGSAQVLDSQADYRSKYLDLQKQHSDLLKKEQILEKKFVELTVSTNGPNAVLHGIADQVPYRQQVNDSKARESRLLIDISRLKQSKDKMYKEKRAFQDKYNATNIQLKEMQVHKDSLLAEIKVLQDKLKVSDESGALLQQVKQDWQDENRSTKEKLKVSLDNIKRLQELNQKYTSEILALRQKMIILEQMVEAFQENELFILVSKELDDSQSMLESAKITNNDLTSEIIALKEKLAIATRSWFWAWYII